MKHYTLEETRAKYLKDLRRDLAYQNEYHRYRLDWPHERLARFTLQPQGGVAVTLGAHLLFAASDTVEVMPMVSIKNGQLVVEVLLRDDYCELSDEEQRNGIWSRDGKTFLSCNFRVPAPNCPCNGCQWEYGRLPQFLSWEEAIKDRSDDCSS